MSLALYRKYRPGRFADVVGQEQVTGPLLRALGNNKVHHAYLLSGPRGCGKTSSARILARSLNCEQGPTPEPCGVCQPCIDLAPNGPGSIDVVEIDAATHRSVENARELRENAAFAPVTSRYTVYIIDEAHQLTKDAGNALLKLIEEPPAHLRFVFATTEPEKILGTIRSRTHHYAFRLVPIGVLRTHLAWICDSEGLDWDPAALTLVARAAEGSVRDALSLLGQLAASVGDEGITYADAVELIGVTDARVLNEVVAAVAASDAAALFSVVDQVIEAGGEPRRFATDVLDRFRDLIVLQSLPDAVERGVIDVPEEQQEDLREQVHLMSAAEFTRAANLLNEGLSSLRGATAPRLTLEILCARLALPPSGAVDLDLLSRIDRLERRFGEVAALGVAPSTAVASGPPPLAPPTAAAVTLPPAAAAAPAPAPPAPAQQSRAPEKPRRAGPRRLSDIAPATSPATASEAPGPSRTEPRAPAVAATPPPSPPESTPAPGGSSPTLEQVRSLWPAVIDEVKTRSRVAWMTVSQSVPLSCTDGTVVAAVADSGAVTHFRKTAYPAMVTEAMLTVLRAKLAFELVAEPSRASGVGSQTTDVGRAETRSRGAEPSAVDPGDKPAGAADAGQRTTASKGAPPAPLKANAAASGDDSERRSDATPSLERPNGSDGGPFADAPTADQQEAADIAESVDAAKPLHPVALIEAALGGEKIAEYEE